MRPRRTRLLFLLGLVAGLVVVPMIVLAITGTVPVSGGVTLESPNGMNATLTGTTDALLSNPFPDADTVEWITEDGNITFSASGAAKATIDKGDITGTFTNITAVDATSNDITANPEDKQSVVIGGDVTALDWPAESWIAVDDDTTDFAYSVANGQTGELTIGGLPANTQVRAADASSGTTLGDATSDGSGEATFSSLDDGSHSVRLQVFNPDAPQLSNPSPTGGLETEPSQIEIDVNDTEFNEGDSVTVTVDLDGSQIHQTTINSNQTVSTSVPASGKTGGEHEWTVEAVDSFSASSVESYSYKVPDVLYIRHELNHTDLVDSPVSINGTFYGENLIFINRTVTDGTVNMTGLPVDGNWVFEARPSRENITERTLWIKSIYQQEDLYLLNTTETDTVDARFNLNDPTGQYDASSVLFVQRGVNISNNITWQTMFSDRFGVEGVTTTLDEGERYRIRVRSDEGDEQIVGPYRADVSETVDVKPGAPTIDLDEFDGGWSAGAELDNDTLEYRYEDPAEETKQLVVWIHEQGDPSNNLVPNSSYFDIGTASAQETLSASEKNKSWVVNFVVDRDGDEFTHDIVVSNKQALFSSLGANWKMILGVGSLILFASAFSLLNATVGAVIIALVGGLWWWIGLLDGATSGAAIILALFITGVVHLARASGP